MLTPFVFVSFLCNGNSSRDAWIKPDLLQKQIHTDGISFCMPPEVRKIIVGSVTHTGIGSEPMLHTSEFVPGCRRTGGKWPRDPRAETETFAAPPHTLGSLRNIHTSRLPFLMDGHPLTGKQNRRHPFTRIQIARTHRLPEYRAQPPRAKRKCTQKFSAWRPLRRPPPEDAR